MAPGFPQEPSASVRRSGLSARAALHRPSTSISARYDLPLSPGKKQMQRPGVWVSGAGRGWAPPILLIVAMELAQPLVIAS